MNSKIPDLLKTRAQILEQMSALDRMERGRLSQQFLKGTKNGKSILWGPYYVLQRRQGRAHLTQRVPLEEVPRIQENIDNHIRFQKLADQYAQVTEELTRLEQGHPDSKKNFKRSNPTTSRKRTPF
jgi:hypothetical protein